jgi:hypothetical protein
MCKSEKTNELHMPCVRPKGPLDLKERPKHKDSTHKRCQVKEVPFFKVLIDHSENASFNERQPPSLSPLPYDKQ